MDFLKLQSLPKILPPRKGRLANLKRSQEDLTPNEHQLAQDQLDKIYPDKDQPIDKQELKILYHEGETKPDRLLRLNLKMGDELINEYASLQLSWADKYALSRLRACI